MNGYRLKVSDFIDFFPNHPAFKDKLSHHEILPRRSAMYKEINPPLLDCITDYLNRKSIHLFSNVCVPFLCANAF